MTGWYTVLVRENEQEALTDKRVVLMMQEHEALTDKYP